MEMLETVFTVVLVISAIVALAFIDKRYHLGLNTGFNDCNWFGYPSNLSKAELAKKDEEINALKQRVAALEKIVTDPVEQLKRDIDNLR